MQDNPQKITLSGALPADHNDGLKMYAEDFLKNPREARLVVGVVSTRKRNEDVDKDLYYPVLQIRHWELVPDKHRAKVAKALADAFADRTGKTELPFEEGAEIPLDFDGDNAFASSVEETTDGTE
jgi:delta 1-pyrroline-5-carboxylate dehydrogenase